MLKQDNSESLRNVCQQVLDDFLLNTEWLPISLRGSRFYIDEAIANYLIGKGHPEFLENDIYYGHQVGGFSESVLCEFVRSERVFDGKAGRFKIKEFFGPFSVRLFYAEQSLPD